MPFTTEKGNCRKLLKLDYLSENNLEELPKDYVYPEMTEESCARRQAKETDYMMELLLNELTERNLLDNTTIVVFTDHLLASYLIRPL